LQAGGGGYSWTRSVRIVCEDARLAIMVAVMRAEAVQIRHAQDTEVPELREREVRIETKVFEDK